MVKKILTDKLYLSVVGIVLVFVAAVAYIFAGVLGQPLTSSPVTVNVQLAQTGGLFQGSAVTYRGINIGKVTKIVPTPQGVEATISISSGTQVPADTIAKVRSLSPVGEQYLDFQPKVDNGPYLQSGDTIPASATMTPQSLAATVVAVNKVLNQIDDKKLRIVLGDLSTGLAGTGDDIGQILDQGQSLLKTLDKVWPQTSRLIDNSGPVLGIVTDNTNELQQLASSSKRFAAFLKGYDPELRSMLKRAPGDIAQLQKLIDDANSVLPGFLTTGVSLTDMLNAYNPSLRSLLQNYRPGVQALLSHIWAGKLHIQLIADKDPRCRYHTTIHKPRQAPTSFQMNGYCPASFATLQRGAAHAPAR